MSEKNLPFTEKDIAIQFVNNMKAEGKLSDWVKSYKPKSTNQYFDKVEDIAYAIATGSKVVDIKGLTAE
jgi:hypothetical protein